MFTGIIRKIGILEKTQKRADTLSFFIHFLSAMPKLKLRKGDSIAVDGVCLTVTEITRNGFRADVIPETLRRTTFGTLKKGARLNLEPSLKLGDSLDGHFVTGHVDARSRVIEKSAKNEMTLKMPKSLKTFIAEKGSIAINGVSLTVARTGTKRFSVALIPFTAKHTTLGALTRGDMVNVEIDLIARYAMNKP